MKTLNIYSSQWARNRSGNRLVNHDGTMCCLGICAVQVHGLSIKPDTMSSPRQVLSLDFVDVSEPYVQNWVTFDSGFSANNAHAELAMAVNDCKTWNRVKDIVTSYMEGEVAREVYELAKKYIPTLFSDKYEAIKDNVITDRERIDILRPIFRELGYRIVFWRNR